MDDKYLMSLIQELAELEQVQAIALAGSHSINMNDSMSDYDVYVYISESIPVKVRKTITEKHCSEMEVNNQFWEDEDDGVLKSGTEIELIYRDMVWLDSELERVVFQHQGSTGYSTCFWANLLNSNIIFDRNGELKDLQQKYQVEYSEILTRSIVSKNLPLLTDSAPNYPKQVSKAVKRDDYVSVQHRLTEYLACYFDILFALNKVPHPGEKRLVSAAKKLCPALPVNFEQRVSQIMSVSPNNGAELPALMKQASEELKSLVNSLFK